MAVGNPLYIAEQNLKL